MMHIDDNTIVICMATYNGECFLKAQLDSILAQSWKNWVLLIGDDGSADATSDILKAYAQAQPDRICLLESRENRGVTENFAALLAHAKALDAPYYAFCDQDDVWLPDKLEKTLARLKACPPGPALVHTDLTVTDRDLTVRSPSFFAYRSLDIRKRDLAHLLVQNNITGCTMLWNRALNALIDLNQPEAVLHDWWVALVASAFGTIACLQAPTVLYRQHGGNAVGATKVNSLSFLAKWVKNRRKAKASLRKAMEQAGAFARCYRQRLTGEQLETVETFANLHTRNKLSRLVTVLCRGYRKQGLLQLLGELLLI